VIADRHHGAEEAGAALDRRVLARARIMKRVHIAQPWPAWKKAGDDAYGTTA
jgi:hypothetical protein